ncbi:Catalase, Mn-containing [Priestia megaterium WSH-002]|uniref:Catalase, Mn-containing n=1 Tax=Priestia megaterium (strain WSH-002) TaxID=1006007 RepID=A0A8D3WXX6_PRIMW|nr:Catalase, Mn-containing [Priestia megaterium WSH-002]
MCIDWGKLFPVPNYDINKYPECRKFVEMGYHNTQFDFRLDPHRMGEIFQGQTPSRNGGDLSVTPPPEAFPVPHLSEMPNEHAPGLGDMNA